MTWVMRRIVPCSRPFERLITAASGSIEPCASANTARNPCDGTPITTTSAPVHASASDDVADSVGGSSMDGR